MHNNQTPDVNTTFNSSVCLRANSEKPHHPLGYSLAGSRKGWYETAFRQEAISSIVLLPGSFWLGTTWVETVLLAGTLILIMLVKLLNTGIETAIDRIRPKWHDLSKRAKDMGSAAMLLSLVLCAGTWSLAILQRLIF